MSEPSLKKQKTTTTTSSSSTSTVEKIAVLGAGSYGTAIAFVLAKYKRAEQVVLYCRNEKQAESITNEHKNPKRFTGCILPDNIVGSSNVEETTSPSTDLCISVTSSGLSSINRII